MLERYSFRWRLGVLLCYNVSLINIISYWIEIGCLRHSYIKLKIITVALFFKIATLIFYSGRTLYTLCVVYVYTKYIS